MIERGCKLYSNKDGDITTLETNCELGVVVNINGELLVVSKTNGEIILINEKSLNKKSKKSISEDCWVSKDNKIYKISEMNDAHITNCIKLIKKTKSTHMPQYKLMLEELEKRKIDQIDGTINIPPNEIVILL